LPCKLERHWPGSEDDCEAVFLPSLRQRRLL
jgi:hypothetical protein